MRGFLSETVYVRKLFARIFQKDDRFPKAEPTLK